MGKAFNEEANERISRDEESAFDDTRKLERSNNVITDL